MKVLEELWNGNVNPSVRKLTPDSEQHELTEYIARHTEVLMSMLSDEARDVFEKLRENQSELVSLNECEIFISGFRLCARIMFEAMEGNNNE